MTMGDMTNFYFRRGEPTTEIESRIDEQGMKSLQNQNPFKIKRNEMTVELSYSQVKKASHSSLLHLLLSL